MKSEQVPSAPAPKIPVLSVAPRQEDHAALAEILANSQSPLGPGSGWSVETSPSIRSALTALRKHEPALVVCESDLGVATWRTLWDKIAALPNPPAFIVTSRLADECLWAEALNLGAYDVLAKPFDSVEVIRTLSQAWLHRTKRPERALTAVGHSRLDPAPGVAV